MRTAILAASAFAFLAVSPSPVSADKITADPNTSQALTLTPRPIADKPDLRLNQKITYSSTEKRLHTVLRELSEQTGVSIQSGKNTVDWQVRDLPVVVCANDMPLGKLLRSIADSTHLAFTSSSVKGVKYYRIWRDGRRERQLADYFKKKSETVLAQANREWDAWLKVSEMSASQIDSVVDGRATGTQVAALCGLAKVIAALPAGSRDSVFQGRKIRLCVKDSSSDVSERLRSLYRSVWEADGKRTEASGSGEEINEERSPDPYSPGSPLTDEVMNSMELFIKLSTGDPAELRFELKAPSHQEWLPAADVAAEFLAGRPGTQTKIEPPRTDYAANLRELDLDDCDGLGLDEKLKVVRPKDEPRFAFADVLSDIAKASGFTIVCEDFFSHRSWINKEELSFYGQKTELRQILLELNDIASIQWHIDVDNKLLVGSSAWQWWNDHVCLAPESVITRLVRKADSDGLEIEDAVSALLLPEDQCREWVFAHRDLFHWNVASRYEPIWRLYAEMSAKEKTMVKSERGLSLIALNASRVDAAFGQCLQAADEESMQDISDTIGRIAVSTPGLMKPLRTWIKERYSQLVSSSDTGPAPDIKEVIAEVIESFPEIKAAFELPSNPAIYPKLSMRLAEHKTQYQQMKEEHLLPAQATDEAYTPLQHSYTMTIEGDGVNMRVGGFDLAFPIYTQRRLEQLAKEEAERQKKAAADAKPKTQ